MGSFTTVENDEKKEFFVSPRHDDFGLDGFVPVTYHYPMYIPALGRNINSPEEIMDFFLHDYKKLSNSELLDMIVEDMKEKQMKSHPLSEYLIEE